MVRILSRVSWLLACAAATGCIEFTDDIPCDHDYNCPYDWMCGPEGICLQHGAPGCGATRSRYIQYAGVTMDAFEASHPDAAEVMEIGEQGENTLQACSAYHVFPWAGATWEEAEFACGVSGKHVCTSDELRATCEGDEGRTYPYGDDYVRERCVDHSQERTRSDVTGDWGLCKDRSGSIYDLVGNLAEMVDGGSLVFGGSWRSSGVGDSARALCDTAPASEFEPEEIGFRCCR